MTKKIKILIAIGGTGGHVFPGLNLAKHLLKNKLDVNLVSDYRGLRFLKNHKNYNIFKLPSYPLNKKNLKEIFISSIQICYSIIRSLIFLSFNRPLVIFGMGGYASFPLCIAASILKIKYVIYENNLIMGKANKILLPFAKKLLVANEKLEGIPKKHSNKIYKIGNIVKEEIIYFSNSSNKDFDSSKGISILILGGSQAAKIFAEILPNIFHQCSSNGIFLKIYQQCLPNQNEILKLFYEKAKIKFEIFNFSDNVLEYFSKVDLAITRSGSSMLAELTNANIPFISVPLPSSADNHQFKNADYYEKKNFAFLVEEKDLNEKLFYLIKDIYNNNSILDKIRKNQNQFSDKNVYNNIDRVLKEIINGKN